MSGREEFLRQLGRSPSDPLTDYPSPWTSQPPAAPWQWQYAKPGPYTTQLDPQQEAAFQQWVRTHNVPFDPSPTSDYDMRGFYQALQAGDARARSAINPNDKRLHYPDVWKTPYHKGFSADSMYATEGAPRWNEQDQLVDRSGRILLDERMAAPAPWTSATANIPTPQTRPLERTRTSPPATPPGRAEFLARMPQPLLPTSSDLIRNRQVPPATSVTGTIGPPSPLQRLQTAGTNYEPIRRARAALDALAPLLESATDLGNLAPGGEGALSAASGLVRTAEEEGTLLRSFGRMQQYMKPEVVETLGNRIKANIAEAFKSLPPTEEWEAAARAGIAKRGWYKNSGAAIRNTFGDDTPVFTGILAATSPRQTVTENLKMATRIFGEWAAAGRPEDPQAIMKILEKVPGATFPSRVPNTIKAIQGEPLVDFTDPASGAGYKVESFRRNLLGEMDWATNDTWMAKFSGKAGEWFSNKANYLAADARTRQVARQMGWSTAEVQETVWSFIKTLVEQTPSSSTLEQGLGAVTHELIGQDTDFAKLLRDPDIQRELSRFGIQAPAAVSEGRAASQAIPGGAEAGDPRVLKRIARRLQRQGIEPVGAAARGAKPPP